MPTQVGIHGSMVALRASSSFGQPRVVEPFTDLRGSDPCAAGVLRIDEDIEFLWNDHGGDDEECRCAGADPIRAELVARSP